MSFHAIMGIVAGIFAFGDIGLYILAVFGRDYCWQKTIKTVPNRATWIIWACVGTILAASYDAAGATDTTWFPAAFAVGFLIIATLSIPYGEGGVNLIDALCLLGAAVAAWIWWEFKLPEVALFATLAMDAFGAIPTIKKSWLEPAKENRLAWASGFVASIANVLAVNWEIAGYPVYSYPIFMLVETGLVTAILILKQPRALQGCRAP